MPSLKHSGKTECGGSSIGSADPGAAWTRLRSTFFVSPAVILSTLVYGAVSNVVSLFDGTGHTQFRIAQAWGRSLLWWAGVQVETQGFEQLRPGTPYILVANHLSYMDTPVLLSQIPVEFRFLAKEGLFQIPFLGWHLHRAGHIPVPREDPRASVKTLARAADMIRQRGISLLIFPEGGRSEDGELQPFIDGAAYLAIKAQAPVVPIALIGTRRILAMGSGTFRRGAVRVRVGEPISTEGLLSRDRGKVTELARARVEELLRNC
jgi:1-acyl-sn-glycerol-3-phosphate acyltransferase